MRDEPHLMSVSPFAPLPCALSSFKSVVEAMQLESALQENCHAECGLQNPPILGNRSRQVHQTYEAVSLGCNDGGPIAIPESSVAYAVPGIYVRRSREGRLSDSCVS